MIEEQGLNANLENIDERIEALNVRQFVRNDRLELFFGQPVSASAARNDRAKPSNYRRRLQPRALAILNGREIPS